MPGEPFLSNKLSILISSGPQEVEVQRLVDRVVERRQRCLPDPRVLIGIQSFSPPSWPGGTIQ
jgi:hypothetical protein